ncbi:MAG TPA: outer membrane beta-barrel protein [Prolixibacteraceae bacterium]|jgi:hypothetical protein
MKKSIILSILGILGFLSSNAQFKIGLTGGVDFPKMSVRREYQNDFRIMVNPGFHVGLASRCQVSENLSIATDLILSRKGLSQSFHEIGFPIGGITDSVKNIDVSLYYIEMPVLMEFKARFEKMNVLFGIGPYVAYGLKGAVDLDIYARSGDIHYSEDVRWSKYNAFTGNMGERVVYESGYSQIKRLDYGPALRFGVEFNSLVLSAEFKYGLANLMWEYRADERMNNQTLGLSARYLFNFKKPAASN